MLAQGTECTCLPVFRTGHGVPLGVQADPERDEVVHVRENIAVE